MSMSYGGVTTTRCQSAAAITAPSGRRMVRNAAKRMKTGHTLLRPSRLACRRGEGVQQDGESTGIVRKTGPPQWQQRGGGGLMAWSEPHSVHAWKAKAGGAGVRWSCPAGRASSWA